MLEDAVRKLFHPASVAVVGASQRAEAVGSVVMANLIKWDFPGDILPVNPRYDEVLGRRCYPSLESLPTVPDAVFLAVPAGKVPGLLDEAGARGVSAAFANGSGFLDAGAEGNQIHEQLLKVIRRRKMALCGPNNMGIINLANRIPLWTSPDLSIAGPGPVAAISQSGAIVISLTYDAGHFDYSYVVTTGNEAVCTTSDYLSYVITDKRIRVVQLFVETVRDVQGFARASLRAHERGVTLIALKAGRSELSRAAVAGHTGAVAGEDAVYDAFFRRLDIVRVDSLDQMVEATKLALARYPLRPPCRLGLVTLSGGEAALAADLAQARRLDLPPLSPQTQDRIEGVLETRTSRHNPVDAWGKGWNPASFGMVVDALAEGPGIDGVLCTINPAREAGHDEGVFVELGNACGVAARRSGKFFGVVSTVAAAGRNVAVGHALAEHGIPYFRGLEAVVAAHAAWRKRDTEASALVEPSELIAAANGQDFALTPAMTEPELFAALTAADLRFVESRPVGTVAAALEAAEQLGYPVALKGTAPDLPHKTNLGLVALNLAAPDDLARVFAVMEPRLERCSAHPSATLAVQRMMPSGLELFASVRIDPQFGLVVAVGIGGVHVEIFHDTAIRLGSVGASEAAEMFGELSGRALFVGQRGGKPYDMDAAARFVSGLSRLCTRGAGRLVCIEVNPLIVYPDGDGAMAVDIAVKWRDGGNRTIGASSANEVSHAS